MSFLYGIPSPFVRLLEQKKPLHKLEISLGTRLLSSPMPLKKKTRSNTRASQDGPDHGDSASRQNASLREEEHASEGTFTLTDLVVAIHVMGET